MVAGRDGWVGVGAGVADALFAAVVDVGGAVGAGTRVVGSPSRSGLGRTSIGSGSGNDPGVDAGVIGSRVFGSRMIGPGSSGEPLVAVHCIAAAVATAIARVATTKIPTRRTALNT